MRTVYLNRDSEFLGYTEVLILTAMGMLPGDDEFTRFPNLLVYRPIIEPALREAVETGMVTLRDAQSFLPLPLGDRDLPPWPDEIRESPSKPVISRADFQEFCKSLGVDVQLRSENYDDDAPTEMGHTIRGAAKALAKKYGISARHMKNAIDEATKQGNLRVRDPKTGMPCDAKKFPTQYEYRISIADLNEWLKNSGVQYELEAEPDNPINIPAEANERSVGKHRDEIMQAFRVMPAALSNRDYWDERLSRPPQWLVAARVSRGKPGMSARWDPLLVAHALLQKGALTLAALDGAIQAHFPGSFEKWKEQTDDVRT